MTTAGRAGIAIAQGNLASAERFAAEAAALHRRAEHFGAGSMLWSALASARVLLGDAVGASLALDDWEREDPRPVSMYRPLVTALCPGGESSPAPKVISVPPGAPATLTTLSIAAVNVELADALG